ncbi:E3 ubiquitin-protein ligase CHFR-like [Littorina saxatilis]|uniref:E3 ubiquitin-protein ligase CHFR n=1 Tax=Littorina saxatilis TaxID=31220 RepID=A0AAN9GBW4_9CAEN
MSEEESTTDWAQLVCLTDVDTPPFLIGKDKFTIGRAKNSDICHENNKLVSGTHCYILRDEDGKVWLYDSSTNGTLLNSKTKLTKGQRQEIEHGDEFYIVYKKGEEDVNIGYIFQDLERLKEEEADDSVELDQTLEYDNGPPPADATLLDDNINQIDDDAPRSAVKRKVAPTSKAADPGPSSKKPREESGMAKGGSTPGGTNPPTTSTATHVPDPSKKEKKEEKAGETKGEKGQGEKEDKEKGTEGEKEDKEKGTEGEKEGKEEEKGGQKKAGKGGGGEEEAEDAIAETLTCIICQELLHDCISLQPCMHSFCAGCYSDWMAQSSECPSCRSNVDRINKNHIVNNLIEAYLKKHPEKKRLEDDLKELDAKNKITRDMLYPKKTGRRYSDYEDSDIEDSDNDQVDEDSDHLTPIFPAVPPPAGGTIFGFGTPVFGAATNAFRAVCRQCPTAGNQAPGTISSAINAIKGVFTGTQTTAGSTTGTTTTTTAAAPSTSGNSNDNNNNTDQPAPSEAGPSGDGDYTERDKKTMPSAPDYVCAANQNHILCQCCLQIFPDRRTERMTRDPEIPPQQCTICYRSYCHAYWGCRKADCNGCLAKFKDLNFGRKVLPGLILDNPTESDIFTRYLDSKEIAVKDVLDTCLAKMAEGAYSCPDQARYNMTGETPLCFACGLRNFKALAYHYRADIPNDELPADARKRPACYWGKNCRTQRNKPPHAMRFNHICEQTRT